MLTNPPKNTVWFVLGVEQHWEINGAEHSSWARFLEVSVCFMFDLSGFEVPSQSPQKAFPKPGTPTLCAVGSVKIPWLGCQTREECLWKQPST